MGGMEREENSRDKALRIATEAHKGQTDKAGEPYINHPLTVESMVSEEDEKIVALLHDVVEDSNITLDDLSKEGFSPAIVSAIDAITKRDGEDTAHYTERVRLNPIARRVKIADLTHNSDLSRIPDPQPEDYERVAKYGKQLKALS